MPLHLLGKKSWNVYNNDNIERVRRDEADAQAREEAAEQRMQEADAARRIAILRRETHLAPPPPEPRDTDQPTKRLHRDEEQEGQPRERKRRPRLRDEDDTAQEIRQAREDAQAGSRARQSLTHSRDATTTADAPLVDHAGHLQLILIPPISHRAEKNAEHEAEKSRKRKREEDLVTVRFSNAAGYDQDVKERPWYASNKLASERTTIAKSRGKAGAEDVKQDVGIDVVDDMRRRVRDQQRISSNDPLAAMQGAQKVLRQSRVDREKWERDREKEIKGLRLEEREKDERRKRRRHHHRRHIAVKDEK
ncbi:hypothetical protein LTR62_008231 [Meristemomyces frigidus]|uniref:CBF1-interacting co-repressor CIR N-terminal domain-containing protein n=1 Tax=Meristemomyces frigidus TaxID=1508187 RepID=A0AAN7TL17_9PEZI|nr:hypothetical protein LTR62_008231 [Meristemomyces frigidus]